MKSGQKFDSVSLQQQQEALLFFSNFVVVLYIESTLLLVPSYKVLFQFCGELCLWSATCCSRIARLLRGNRRSVALTVHTYIHKCTHTHQITTPNSSIIFLSSFLCLNFCMYICSVCMYVCMLPLWCHSKERSDLPHTSIARRRTK